jgi:hypothetical protein
MIDGLSVAVAGELVATTDGWVEYALPSQRVRGGALAVLPTLTENSRCSLLSGELGRSAADAERCGFAQLLKRFRLGGADNGADEVPSPEGSGQRPTGLALAPYARTAIAEWKVARSLRPCSTPWTTPCTTPIPSGRMEP